MDDCEDFIVLLFVRICLFDWVGYQLKELQDGEGYVQSQGAGVCCHYPFIDNVKESYISHDYE